MRFLQIIEIFYTINMLNMHCVKRELVELGIPNYRWHKNWSCYKISGFTWYPYTL